MVPVEIRDALQRLREVFPLTFAGVFLGAVLYVTSEYLGEDEKDYIARNAVDAMALIGAASGISTLLASGAILVLMGRMNSVPQSGNWETGERHSTGFSLPSLAWWPFAQMSLRWTLASAEVDLVPTRQGMEEWVRFTERGRHQVVERSITVRGLFGLFAVTLRKTFRCQYRVTPTRSLLSVTPEFMMADGDGLGHPEGDPVGDLVETRRYAPGDPIRLVLWKAYARSRRLLVRDHESAVSVLPSATAYFLSGPDDEPSATTARTILESGVLGDDLSFGADGTPSVSRNSAGALEAIIESIHHRESGGRGLAAFIDSVERTKLRRCLLFVPSVSGPWLDTLRAVIPKMPGQPVIFVTMAGTLKPARKRFSVFGKTPKVANGDFETLYRTLEEMGGTIQVVHHEEGRTLSSDEVRALHR